VKKIKNVKNVLHLWFVALIITFAILPMLLDKNYSYVLFF